MINGIRYLFRKCEDKVYAFVFGVLLSSTVLLIIQTFRNNFKIIHLVIGLIFMIIGIVMSSLLEDKK